MRYLLLILPLALAACTEPAPIQPRDAFLAAYDSALVRGDVEHAVRLLRTQAKAGDVVALGGLALLYDKGFVRVPQTREVLASSIPVKAWPGQARLWRARYERERDRQAQEGDLDALLYVAQDLEFLGPTAEAHASVTQADRDSADVIRQRLVVVGHPVGLFLAGANVRKEDPQRGDSLLALAEAAGSYEACRWRATFGGVATSTSLSDQIDRGETCRGLLNGRIAVVPSEDLLRGLRQAAAGGTPEAAAHLDSLRILGVFERHPHLDQI